MSIIIQHLSYTYNPKSPFEKQALNDISLTVDAGDFFGVIGHTGSGKSTLIGHLNGLIKLKEGSVTVGGIDLSKKVDYKKLRAKVGMLFQYPEYQLFAETVAKDVAFGPKNIGIKGEELEQRVRRSIELVGLRYEEVAGRSPFELSGGQMRRVALAGVLAMNPEILVLDEPTAGLDPQGKREILQLILDVKKSCPTIIMISHNMDEISMYCNRIAVLSGGKLEGVFTPKELFRQTDLIGRLHLELPTISKIAKGLFDQGWDIDLSTLTEAELVDAIVRYKKGEQTHA